MKPAIITLSAAALMALAFLLFSFCTAVTAQHTVANDVLAEALSK